MNVILMGDLLQLRPCRGGYTFKRLPKLAAEPHLWGIFTMNVLFKNQRHIGDTAYRQETADDLRILNDRHNIL
jgi:hypothetical protein